MAPVRAASTADDKSTFASSTSQASVALTATGTGYGLFDLLDHRSVYGQGVFPEPLLADELDVDNEFRVDWLHTRAHGAQGDGLKAEVEKSFGLLTLEVESSYQSEKSDGETSQGVGNIDIGARYPFYEYVSANGFVNTTFGAAIEVGIPTFSHVSQSAEIVPKLFNGLFLGDHFSLQSIVGYSMLAGGDDDGLRVLEYSFVFGYTIQHRELPLPGVLQFIPLLELKGETELNKDNPGSTFLGDVGFRANLKAIGPVQPRLGAAFVFPLNQRASEDTNMGFVVSMVFEY